MRIGLIDVDGHNFPNMALMHISSYHKAKGDRVEWWLGDLFHYDVVYMSKVFSFSPDVPEPVNADSVIKGGTGYCISLIDGREVFDQAKNVSLPAEIESSFPDYSIYPEYHFAVSQTSRGCPRGCSFCHVASKEGRRAHKVADVKDFYSGQAEIEVLDPNFTALPEADKRDLFQQYKATGAKINFNQGLDIRLLTERDIEDLNSIKVKNLHFAWDRPQDDLKERFKAFSELYKPGKKNSHGSKGTVYVLTNFNSTMDENLYRIYTLRDLGYQPYVMIYDKAHAPKEIKRLQRWVNNNFIFWKTKRFEDYEY